MLKKACVFGLLATATVLSFSCEAFAGSAKSGQLAGQDASAIGKNNQVRQVTNQVNLLNLQQPLLGSSSKKSGSDATSLQGLSQKAQAIGTSNQIKQQNNQLSLQQIPNLLIP